MTASAVGQLQLASGLVSGQNDPGYGITGPKTRAAISCSTPPPLINGSLSASPTSGNAPLAVSFTGNSLTGGSQYIIGYGDGGDSGVLTASTASCTLDGVSCVVGGIVGANHTYAVAGTYTATLKPYIACCLLVATQNLGQVTITVTGGQSATLSATPTSGVAPLVVTFTRPSSTNYTLNFGDGTTNVGCMEGDCSSPTMSVSHTYQAAGTYTATLSEHVGGPSGPEHLIGSVTISVRSY